MEVEFEYQPADKAIYAAEYPWRAWWNNVFWIFCGVLIGIPGVIPALLLDYFWVACVIAIVYYSGLFRYARQLLLPPPEAILHQGIHRARLTPHFLEESGTNHRVRIAWSHIEQVTQSREAVMIYLNPQLAMLVPPHAFASPHEMCQFAKLAAEYRTVALQTSLPAIGLYDDDFFAAWAREAGLSVEYQNTRPDWAHAMQSGAYESPWYSFSTRLSKSIVFLVLSAAMLWMAFNMNHVGFQAFALVASAVFWYVSSISLIFLEIERRVRRTVPEQSLATRTLFISPIGVIELTSFGIHCTNWLGFENVVQNSGFIYFLTADGVSLLAPKRAFPTFGQAEHFAHQAQQWFAAAHGPAKEEVEGEVANDAGEAEPADGDNPYRSPQA